jgi:nucleoside-diphosphate-sugar epimerase
MTILVTGATGFIGRHVVRRLAAEGRPLRVLCRQIERLDPDLRAAGSIEIVIGDVSDPAVMRRACSGVSALLHLAGGTHGSPEDFERSSVTGTKVMLDAVVSEGVDHVVYVSSMSVYDYAGLPPGTIIDEDAPLERHPESRDDYARTKRLAEALVTPYLGHTTPTFCIVRPGIVYGPRSKSGFELVTSLRRMGGLFLLVGGGRRQIPLVYVENLVDALLLLLDSPSSAGHVYNVIDSDPPTERGYLETLQRVTASRSAIVPVPRWVLLPLVQAAEWRRRLSRRGGMDLVHGFKRVTGDIRFDAGRLQRELGWKSRYGLLEGARTAFGVGPEPAGALRNAHGESEATVRA